MDVFDLYAKLSLDSSGYDRALNDAAANGTTFGTKMAIGMKVVGSAVSSVASKLIDVGKSALDSYAKFEQLEGGVKTLFGDEAAKTVMDNASKAFKTAGMSANEYMSTTIESSAAMIKALNGDTAKAADMMDMSIIDMADNVNKMGTTMEGVQNAYRGFSRGNFTMLDNLALGFSGTKEGMEELLEKAEEYSAKNGEIRDFSIDSYADIVEAIHIVQDEMGITGTTTAEASSTIQGSLTSVKGAWQNLLTGMADPNQDIGKLVDDLVDTVVDATNVIVPKIRDTAPRVISGLAQLITELTPVVIELIVPVIPEIIMALVNAIVDNIPVIVDAGIDLLTALIEDLPTIISAIIEAVPKIVRGIVDAFAENWDSIKEAGSNLLHALGDGLMSALGWLKEKAIGIADDVVGWFKGVFGIASPSKVFAEIGDNLALGLGEGYADTMMDVAKDMQKVAEEAIPTVSAESVWMDGNHALGYGYGDIIVNIEGSGLSIDEIASSLGTAVRRQVRMSGGMI